MDRSLIGQETGLGIGDLVEVTMFNRDELLELSRSTKANLIKQRNRKLVTSSFRIYLS
jgi:hypothetical protein